MIDWLNDNSGAVQGVAAIASILVLVGLALVTRHYARETERIAKATDEQAKAATKMSAEVREQTLQSDRPYLLIEAQGPASVDFGEPEDDESRADPHSGWPQFMEFRVFNAGRGPAKEIGTTIHHPGTRYRGRSKDVLPPGEFWEVKVEVDEPHVVAITDSFGESPPRGLDEFLQWVGVPKVEPDSYSCGIVVTYVDIHESHYITYLRFGMIATTDMIRRTVLTRGIRPVEQRMFPLVDQESSHDP